MKIQPFDQNVTLIPEVEFFFPVYICEFAKKKILGTIATLRACKEDIKLAIQEGNRKEDMLCCPKVKFVNKLGRSENYIFLNSFLRSIQGAIFVCVFHLIWKKKLVLSPTIYFFFLILIFDFDLDRLLRVTKQVFSWTYGSWINSKGSFNVTFLLNFQQNKRNELQLSQQERDRHRKTTTSCFQREYRPYIQTVYI